MTLSLSHAAVISKMTATIMSPSFIAVWQWNIWIQHIFFKKLKKIGFMVDKHFSRMRWKGFKDNKDYDIWLPWDYWKLVKSSKAGSKCQQLKRNFWNLFCSMLYCIMVVWNDYLFIFLTKMSYFTSQEVRNPVQIIKYVELSRFQSILKLSVTFIENLFTLKPFIGDFYKFRLVTKWGAIHISNFLLCLNIDYIVWFVLKAIFCWWLIFHLQNCFGNRKIYPF